MGKRVNKKIKREIIKRKGLPHRFHDVSGDTLKKIEEGKKRK